MAQTATIYNLKVELADIDRGVYETFDLRMARQPSETVEFMLIRLLAYCLEYAEGIEFTEGVAAGSEPAVLIRDLTGRTTAWIEVGMPDAARVHRGRKHADRAAVYTHRNVNQLLDKLSGERVYRVEEIPIYAFDPAFIGEVAARLERRTELALSITERELYLTTGGQSFTTPIVEHRVA